MCRVRRLLRQTSISYNVLCIPHTILKSGIGASSLRTENVSVAPCYRGVSDFKVGRVRCLKIRAFSGIFPCYNRYIIILKSSIYTKKEN